MADGTWQLPLGLVLGAAGLLAMVFAPGWTVRRYLAAVAAWQVHQLQECARQALGFLGGTAVMAWMWVNALTNLWLSPDDGFRWLAALIFALVCVVGVAGALPARPCPTWVHRDRI